MSKTLTVGSETFEYPEQGTSPGWGEEATDWAVAISKTVATLSGPNDINTTTFSIADNQSCAQNVGTGASALTFSIAAVRAFTVDYSIIRGANAEVGQLNGVYNGSSWALSNDLTGDAGMAFQITAAGQVQYFSDTKGTGTMVYRARTIDQ